MKAIFFVTFVLAASAVIARPDTRRAVEVQGIFADIKAVVDFIKNVVTAAEADVDKAFTDVEQFVETKLTIFTPAQGKCFSGIISEKQAIVDAANVQINAGFALADSLLDQADKCESDQDCLKGVLDAAIKGAEEIAQNVIPIIEKDVDFLKNLPAEVKKCLGAQKQFSLTKSISERDLQGIFANIKVVVDFLKNVVTAAESKVDKIFGDVENFVETKLTFLTPAQGKCFSGIISEKQAIVDSANVQINAGFALADSLLDQADKCGADKDCLDGVLDAAVKGIEEIVQAVLPIIEKDVDFLKNLPAEIKKCLGAQKVYSRSVSNEEHNLQGIFADIKVVVDLIKNAVAAAETKVDKAFTDAESFVETKLSFLTPAQGKCFSGIISEKQAIVDSANVQINAAFALADSLLDQADKCGSDQDCLKGVLDAAVKGVEQIAQDVVPIIEKDVDFLKNLPAEAKKCLSTQKSGKELDLQGIFSDIKVAIDFVKNIVEGLETKVDKVFADVEQFVETKLSILTPTQGKCFSGIISEKQAIVDAANVQINAGFTLADDLLDQADKCGSDNDCLKGVLDAAIKGAEQIAQNVVPIIEKDVDFLKNLPEEVKKCLSS